MCVCVCVCVSECVCVWVCVCVCVCDRYSYTTVAAKQNGILFVQIILSNVHFKRNVFYVTYSVLFDASCHVPL